MTKGLSSRLNGNAGHESPKSSPTNNGMVGLLSLGVAGEKHELVLKLSDVWLNQERADELASSLKQALMDEMSSLRAKVESLLVLHLGTARLTSPANVASHGPTEQ